MHVCRTSEHSRADSFNFCAGVCEQAQVVKHELMFVDPNATKEQQREMREHRKGSMDRFMTRTGLLGRRIAFQRARREVAS